MKPDEVVRHLMPDIEIFRETLESFPNEKKVAWLKKFDQALETTNSAELAELVKVQPNRKDKTFRLAIETARMILAVWTGDSTSPEYQQAMKIACHQQRMEEWASTPAKSPPEPVENDHHTPWDSDWKGM